MSAPLQWYGSAYACHSRRERGSSASWISHPRDPRPGPKPVYPHPPADEAHGGQTLMLRPALVLSIFFAFLSWHYAQAAAVEMIRIPPGPFLVGSDDGPADERPEHKVGLPAFSIDKFPVTN